MDDPDRQARAVFLAPVVQAACAFLVHAMDDLGENASRQALASMVTVAAMAVAGDNGAVVDLARKLDAHVILVGPAPTDGAGPAQDAAHLAGRLKRAGIPFRQVASVPAPPVPLGLTADELWNSSKGEQHG